MQSAILEEICTNAFNGRDVPPYSKELFDSQIISDTVMKRLIVNADDFGMSRGINEGILRAFECGCVTSATIMATGLAFDHAARLSRENTCMSVGIHLTLIGGKPLMPAVEVPSLVSRDGSLPNSVSSLLAMMISGRIRPADIQREFRSQILHVLNAGISPSHYDTHKHTHVFPRVMDVVTQLATEFGIKYVRNPFESAFNIRLIGEPASGKIIFFKQHCAGLVISLNKRKFERTIACSGLKAPDHFHGVSLTGLLNKDTLAGILKSLGEGTSELMCHPGFHDSALDAATTRLKQEREIELHGLTDPALKRIAGEEGIEFISYRDLNNLS